eukprot:5224325-Amphidinium_carterae.1
MTRLHPKKSVAILAQGIALLPNSTTAIRLELRRLRLQHERHCASQHQTWHYTSGCWIELIIGAISAE